MNSKDTRTNKIPQKIINTYYQKFYQERKNSLYASPVSKIITSSISQKSKENVIFQINYETTKRQHSQAKSTNSKKMSKSLSKSSALNLAQSHTQKFESQSQTLTQNLLNQPNSLNIPKKNITFEADHKKQVKGQIKHIKSESKRRQLKVSNFQHFPEGNELIKNQNKQKNSVDHFFTVHKYSKTVDFENIKNPEKELTYFHSTVEVSPQKNDKLFTLQNFSHIQVHKNKKNSHPQKQKQVIDIVKRKNVAPNQNIMESSMVFDCEKTKEKSTNNQRVQEKAKIQQRAVTPSSFGKKEGLFKQFKPKIQLKRRPSTGIPLRKNRNSIVHSAMDQHHINLNPEHPNDKIQNFFNVLDKFNMDNWSPSGKFHSRKQTRQMSIQLNSPRGLKIHSKQIHLLQYVDLSQADQIKDYFQNSKDLGHKELKNLVHLQLHKRGGTGYGPRYTGNKKKKIQQKKQDEFKPWQSIDRDDQIIQSDQLIKREIEDEIFSQKL